MLVFLYHAFYQIFDIVTDIHPAGILELYISYFDAGLDGSVIVVPKWRVATQHDEEQHPCAPDVALERLFFEEDLRSDLDESICFLSIPEDHHEILRLNVSVDDALVVQLLDGQHDLAEDLARSALGQSFAIHHLVEQFRPFALLEHQLLLDVVLIHVLQLYDVRVVDLL